MTAAVKIQPQGFSVQYPKTQWRVSFVEDSAGKFRFLLSGQNFKFEPRARYRYPSHDDARRAAHCFLELMKRLERSRMKLSILAEIGILKFPQETYRQHELWLIVDRTRYTWEAITASGFCWRSQRWYKQPDTAIVKARIHIDRELAVSQIRGVVGWV
ncbi:hypothetical protein H6F98_12065 [Microcoleus sp. FACHB-SPT15]|uniref:hypothetical protein n=1 Tax=Microcoleus sp. FACHB-SPT15 TaxID=2692830 RepID=UPI0017805297|nr:hypothetical protein [Microcoleus sp. FACHB-SPT15]MBD1806182.1 hypothetical protein [Microcoleus sp. FACHB-SPT15]